MNLNINERYIDNSGKSFKIHCISVFCDGIMEPAITFYRDPDYEPNYGQTGSRFLMTVTEKQFRKQFFTLKSLDE